MLFYKHDLEPESRWLLVESSQFPWGLRGKHAIPYVQELGDFLACRGFFTQREQLPSYLLKYTISGEGMLEYEGRSYRLRPGECFWIDCQKFQKYYTAPAAENWHVIWMHFYGDPCQHYYRLFLENNDMNPVVRMPPGNRIAETLQELLRDYSDGESNPSRDIRVSGQVTEMMISLILGARDSEDRLTPESVRSVQAYIDEHYREPITLEPLSRQFCINKYHLLRLFRRYVGVTPHEYLTKTRVRRSKELLRFTELPVGEIATRVGFDHAGHFIELFKRNEGVTPGAYRRNWQG